MNVASLMEQAEDYLAGRSVPEVAANAEFLMAAALNIGRAELALKQDAPLSPQTRKRFWNWALLRGRRIPLAYVLGTQPFSGMELTVKPGVLIPRPETEELAEIAIQLARRLQQTGKRHLRVLDIGAGSGCLALAVARAVPDAEIVGTDISRKAIAAAQANARNLGLASRVKFCHTCGNDDVEEFWKADLVVSNPPYIPSARLSRLEPEVRREPRRALDGGPDGLKVIRQVVAQAVDCLKPGGWLALEMDSTQGRRIKRLLGASGFRQIEVRRDFQGLERFAIGKIRA